jgi:hypothetical protein
MYLRSLDPLPILGVAESALLFVEDIAGEFKLRKESYSLAS